MNSKIIRWCVLLLCLSGCSRYADWARRNFKQATPLADPSRMSAPYVRNTRVYDEFKTVLLADVLWVSQPIITQKAALIARKNIFDNERREQLLYDLNQEYASKTEFYILIGPDTQELPALSITQPALWSLTLQSNGVNFQPQSVTSNSTDSVFESMIPIRNRRYRNAYKVAFPVIVHQDQEIALTFRSLDYEVQLIWNKKQ